ncbi:transglutaminase family protein [Nocardioides donggukensis]|uniref:Transglutaminase domain-containing protein n=1 Tax=Nocardioides donggukensis TaxID=2774019 RepID=A0A927Q1Z9_9ACTN|nr:DUF3488 and transglutaminase-like domain-containing protein [Nocardioides donggukensis]MBD8869206.1 transglutaminase domain-containing protein [Nocardioides donggukensis]
MTTTLTTSAPRTERPAATPQRTTPTGSTRLVLASALTAWLTLFAWSGFVERPGTYLNICLVGILLIGGVGLLARRVRFPGIVVVAAQALALMLFANAVWGSAWWPSPASVEATMRSLGQAVTASQQYAAPVPAQVTAVVPLLALGGLVCYLLVDLCAVTLGRVPLAGLPLLLVYSLPVSLLDRSVGWPVFAASAFGFLLMLTFQEGDRIRRWGRPLGTGSPASTVSAQRDTVLVGATATGLAVLLPLLIPTLDLSVFAGGAAGSAGGGREVSIRNPMTDLRRDLTRGADVPVLRVRTDGAETPSYVRLSVLTTFTGRAWTPGARDLPSAQAATGAFPAPIGLAPGVPRATSEWELSTTDAFDSLWLPTPLYVNRVVAGEDWRFDNEVLDVHAAEDDVSASNLDYSLTALRPEITASALVRAGAPPFDLEQEYTELPEDLPGEVLDYATEVTQGLRTDFERAQALQEWFRSEFTYSLERSTEGNSSSDLVDFLTPGTGRVGYCEQFSASMALMARALDIPARVSVGFLNSSQIGEDLYEFSAHDLHAWPELYFDGFGWVRFEPTPQDRARTVPGYSTEELPSDPTTEQPTGPTDEATASDGPQRPTESAAPTAGDAEDDSTGGGLTSAPFLWGGAGLLFLVGLALAPGAVRRTRTERRWRAAGASGSAAVAAEVAWAELRDSVVDCGLTWPSGRSPRVAGALVARSLGAAPDRTAPDRPATGPHANPDASRALDKIVAAVEQARYAAVPAPVRVEELREAVATCVTALRGGLTPRARFRAEWLPASVLSPRHAVTPGPALTRVRSHQDVVDHVG